MVAIRKALVVGGGVGGMSAAIRLREQGAEVTLIDADPQWRVYGAGISIIGPTLRALKRLGVLEEVGRHGAFSGDLRFFRADGGLIGEVPVPRVEEGVPPTGGIMRPRLHSILSDHVRASGTEVRLGVTVESFEQDDGGVDVRFSDGEAGRFDLMIGADGCYSKLRSALFPDAPKPKFTGQGCWRVTARRPERVNCPEIYMGRLKAGVTPCSADEMYLFLLDNVPDNPFFDPADHVETLRGKLASFGGTIAEVRDGLGPDSTVIYRPLEALLLPLPWHEGRVVLIGDAVHATTPHLASGAGMAVEDGIVLSEELERAETIEAGLTAFEQRRFDRCRMVVENSVRIGELEQQGADPQETSRFTGQAMGALAGPM